MTLEISLDINDRWMEDKAGNATMRYKYDSHGNLVKAIALDRSERVTLLKESKIAMYELAYDEWGNCTEIKVFDPRHRPSIDATEGSHAVQNKYDNDGHLVELSWLDPEGRPCFNKDGIAREVLGLDKNGYIALMAFFGIDRKP